VLIGGFYIPGVFVSLVLGFAVSHVFLGLWLTAEHTGCPFEGTVIERTRTLQSNRLLRFFLWNMNYHSEHHGWPGVPWYRLQQLNEKVEGLTERGAGYIDTYWLAYKESLIKR
jgi:fatty acid desaturase